MNKYLIYMLLFSMTTGCGPGREDGETEAPVAPKHEKELVTHGDTRIDPYYWMNDRDDPEVIDYLEAENAYLDEMMGHTEDLQKTLFQEMKNRIREDDQSAPYFSNGYYYYVRYEEGGEYPIYCRKPGSLDAEEEVMLDVNKLAEPHPYFNVGDYDVSLDNRWMAFTADTVGRRQYTINVKDLATGEVFSTGIANAGGDVVWAADNQTFFFTSIDPNTLRYERIQRYNFFHDEEPEEVYYEADETFYYIGVSRTKDDRYLRINANSTLTTEVWLLDANEPSGEFEVFQPRQRDLRYSVASYNGKFFVLTNHEAENFRLMETRKDQTTIEHWKEVIPHRSDVLLEDIELFDDFLVVQERERGLRQLRIINRLTDKSHYIPFEEEAYTARIGVNAEMSTPVLRFNYTSPTTPSTTYDYHMGEGERTLVKQQEVLGDFDPDDYETRRFYATARDGVDVPLTIVYKKGIERDGKNPLLLYGYGSYGSSADPRFNRNALSLLDRGFLYAIAHVRGGQELGRQWYEDGKLLNKKNTFNDFIDCAEFLIEKEYTSPEHLYARGGSAGGLLMGAVINQRPDLFNGVIAAVPFVDVVTTMLDESIPLTTAEYDEWGNPNDPEYYEYMLSYSPYDNITEQAYPNLLVTSGLHDSQVQYWEPSKWVARLRDHHTGDNLILLYTNMEAGHGGASGRFQRLRELAREYAFLLDLEGKS
ncbi:MAG: S9 family peptidase [Bacteroidales bacterium]